MAFAGVRSALRRIIVLVSRARNAVDDAHRPGQFAPSLALVSTCRRSCLPHLCHELTVPDEGRGKEQHFMKILRIFGPLALGLLLQGCAAAAIGVTLATAGAGAGMTAGVEHKLNGIVYKTFSAPANEVRFATLKTLDRMGMPLTDDEKTETGWKLSASAKDRSVEDRKSTRLNSSHGRSSYAVSC